VSAVFPLMQLADLQAIRNVLACHSRGIDRADVGLLADCYHDDGTVDYRFFAGPARQFAEILIGAQLQGPVTLHRTAQMLVSIDGDAARSESYVMAYAADSSAAEIPHQRLICGRYLDRHEKRDGAWRMAHRTYVLDSNCNWPGRFDSPPLGSLQHHVPVGAHGARDPGLALLGLAKARRIEPSKGSEAMTASSSNAALLDGVISRQQIADLTMAYCRGIDRADPVLLSSLFHGDAAVVSGPVNAPGPQFARDICRLVEAEYEQTFHSIANQWIDLDGDLAIGETYVIAVSTTRDTGDGRMDTLTGGRYVDRFERRSGVWKFAERSFVLDWMRSEPSTRDMRTGLYAALDLQGCRGKADPVYGFLEGRNQ